MAFDGTVVLKKGLGEGGEEGKGWGKELIEYGRKTIITKQKI